LLYTCGMSDQFSISEEHGLDALKPNDLSVYSVGVSTAGNAEIRMAKANKDRKIIATTIDQKGAAFAEERIKEQGFDGQITVKLEDCAQPLTYADGTFDYIYARLVLHYLNKQQLTTALAELRRVLKPGGSLFIVVRSTKNIDYTSEDSTHDPESGFTTYTTHPVSGNSEVRRRMFHTPGSISEYVRNAGFSISEITDYQERLFDDFHRKVQAEHEDNVIELMAAK
jgi:cyclopropane fatty-acyl-phospholipid synthase-like methyltransferase